MATYYHGNSEIAGGGGGGDGLQTLILMNPAYVGYSDAGQQPPSSNFVFLNSTSTVNTLPHAPPSNGHHLVGFQLQNTTSTSTASPQEQQQHGFLQSVPYNLYNLPVENAAARAQQGLSLSLSSQHPPPGYGSLRASPPRREEVRASCGSPSPASGVSNGVESVLLSSKYLSAAQELLDEVVNVGKGAKSVVESSKGQAKSNGDSATTAAASGEAHSGGGDSSGKRGAELTTAERQEIQMKKAKLVNMLDEVEQRYRQYQQQMQMVITWFEQAAGAGAAKTYTAVALETISKQFRCLKDAIIGQIRGASKSLGEEENNNVEGSRLKYVDNQMRQQRALQQLGMIHHNAAWRPQRGLPERSVSVLRAWLFEHFLHPYPKDSDKLMLAKQTGLTRSQVSNWFINARVRLWKPMVEEMYTEEMKDHDKNGNANDTTTKIEQKNNDDDNPTTKSSATPQVKSPASEQQHNKTFVDNFINNNTVSPPPRSPTMPSFNLISETGRSSPKKLRISNMLHSTTTVAATIPPSITMDSKPYDSDNDTMLMKFSGDRQDREGFTLMGAPTNFIGAYPMGDLGRFGTEQFQTPYSGNGVSLTLGLPHCENIAMSGAHQSFLPNQTMQLGRSVEIGEANDFGGMDASANAHSANVYDINIQNRKRFAAQLLPDFVA